MLDFKGGLRNFLNKFNRTKNYGVQQEERIGGLGTAELVVLQEDGQWLDYLPFNEYQNIGSEKMSCVTFSLFNCFEIIGRRKGVGQFNFSDRFTATLSGTTFTGNTFYNVFSSVLNDGTISNILWDNEVGNNTWSEWYSQPPDRIKKIAKENMKELDFVMEWVSEPLESTKIMDALRYSPLWISLYAYGPKVNGIYQKAPYSPNHAVTLVGYKKGEYWIIFDHYKGNEIRKIAWDVQFGGVAKVGFKLKK